MRVRLHSRVEQKPRRTLTQHTHYTPFTRSNQMSGRLHTKKNKVKILPQRHLKTGSIWFPGDEFKTPVISLVSKPPDKNLVTSKPRNFSGEVNTIAVLCNVDNLSRPQSKFISEPCQSSREFSMSDDVVQTTNKENEIQCYSCEETPVVQGKEIISDANLEEVFPVPRISRHVVKDKQNIQHGECSLRNKSGHRGSFYKKQNRCTGICCVYLDRTVKLFLKP